MRVPNTGSGPSLIDEERAAARRNSSAGLDRKGLFSILMPVYNEEEFLEASVIRALEAPLPEGLESELIAVDDGSTDSSPEILRTLTAQYPGRIRVFTHDRNHGKGAALRSALEHAAGEFGIVQDSDIEYDPAEYGKLLGPLLSHKADVVYGSRFMSSGERKVLYYWHSVANHLLTTACNMAADLNLTDMETCYKAFRLSLIRSIPLRSNRFGIEPEITVKLAKRRVSIYEVPISYHGRTYEEGKKIGFGDAVNSFFVILRESFTRNIYVEHGGRILHTLSESNRFNRWMADAVRPFIGRNVLEVGAGIGNMTRQLCPGRRAYMAVDIDEEHLARLRSRFQGRPNFTSRECDLQDPRDFEDLHGRFDTIVCLNVLEHIEDDVTGLRNIFSALAPGGRTIILVPHDQRIYGTLDKVLGHHRRYSERELSTKMEQAGFSVEKIIHFNRITRPGWYLNGRILRRTEFGRFQLRLFDLLVPVWRRIDNVLPWPAVSIVGIGIKR